MLQNCREHANCVDMNDPQIQRWYLCNSENRELVTRFKENSGPSELTKTPSAISKPILLCSIIYLTQMMRLAEVVASSSEFNRG